LQPCDAPERAKVTSLEALEDFRAKLIVYRDKASRVLDEVSDDVTRTRVWLESERPAYWQNQIRRLNRDLETAQQELFSAQLSGLRDASYAQQADAVGKIRRSIRDAEDKAKTVKQWQRQFDTRVESPARQVGKAAPLSRSRCRPRHRVSQRSHQEHCGLRGIVANKWHAKSVTRCAG
jgi:hypothetical protein